MISGTRCSIVHLPGDPVDQAGQPRQCGRDTGEVSAGARPRQGYIFSFGYNSGIYNMQNTMVRGGGKWSAGEKNKI